VSDDLQPEPDEEPTAPFWMATFSDMVTLLLAFFVMIVAMSEVEVKRFEEALSYFTGQRGMLRQEAAAPTPVTLSSSIPDFARAERFEQVLEALRERGLLDAVELQLTRDGVHLTLRDSVMFASGEAALIEPARTVLTVVAGILTDLVEEVRVEGHTDNVPIHTERFPSNWELSGARAASVVRFLTDQPDALSPAHYTAMGHGEHRPRATNDTPQGRARNRRVAIFFRWTPWPNAPTPPPPNPTPPAPAPGASS
jgi:chemotaxis protein MotB